MFLNDGARQAWWTIMIIPYESPLFDRWFLGRYRHLRGYRYRQVGPVTLIRANRWAAALIGLGPRNTAFPLLNFYDLRCFMISAWFIRMPIAFRLRAAKPGLVLARWGKPRPITTTTALDFA